MTSEALAQRSWSVFAGAGVAVVTVVVLMVVVVVVVMIVVALMEVAVVLAAAAVKTPVTTNRQARVRRKVPEASLGPHLLVVRSALPRRVRSRWSRRPRRRAGRLLRSGSVRCPSCGFCLRTKPPGTPRCSAAWLSSA